MAIKRFTYIGFDPPLWSANPVDPQYIVLDVEVVAPKGTNRDVLRSRIFPVADSPSDSFNTFIVRHDLYRRHITYDPDDPDSEVTVETTLVFPDVFNMYELTNRSGSFYATTSTNNLKELFRRYRDSTGQHDYTFNLRILDLDCVHPILQDAEVIGYSLLNVSGVTPYRHLQAEGPQIDQNPEA